MMHHFQFNVGDIFEDPTGLRVKVEDIDIYDYVHFSVVNDIGEGLIVGEMSRIAFDHRFARIAERAA